MTSTYRVEVFWRGQLDGRALDLLDQISHLAAPPNIKQVQVSNLYFLRGSLVPEALDRIATELLVDPVVEGYRWQAIGPPVRGGPLDKIPHAIEVGLHPGVTDPVATHLLKRAHLLGITALKAVTTGARYVFEGDLTPDDLHRIARQILCNDVIQFYTLGQMMPEFVPRAEPSDAVDVILLRGLDDEALQRLSVEPVLYLSGDLPFATPQEISEFIERGLALGCDYAVGLVPAEAMADFLPGAAGEPGVRVAYFNMREGRFRQSNLHLAKPARITNRYYVEEMYELRYQKEFANIAKLAWTILRSEQGGLRILFLYLLVHLAGVLNRNGFRGLADKLRKFVSLERVEACISTLLRTDYRFVITEAGGCALDIDNQQEYEASAARFREWTETQAVRAEKLYGPPRLAPGKVE